MRPHGSILLAALISVLWTPLAHAQIILGQQDNFQDGSLQNWTNGLAATDPINIPDGGPLGTGDRYLQVSSGSFGGGIRSIIFNNVQWLGNYNAAGVTRIELDLKNFGDSTLSMRFALRTFSGGQFTPGYVSLNAFTLPNDGDWHHAAFLLDEASLMALNSPPPLNSFLDNVGDARLLHATSPSLLGDVGSTRWGVDNITAASIAVPEPAAWLMLLAVAYAALRLLCRKWLLPPADTTSPSPLPSASYALPSASGCS